MSSSLSSCSHSSMPAAHQQVNPEHSVCKAVPEDPKHNRRQQLTGDCCLLSRTFAYEMHRKSCRPAMPMQQGADCQAPQGPMMPHPRQLLLGSWWLLTVLSTHAS